MATQQPPGTPEPRHPGTSRRQPIVTHSEGETAAVGRDVGRRLRAGNVVLLEGPLGAGKTAFARGVAEGLGCDGEDVSSPTFTIVQEYRSSTRARSGLRGAEGRGRLRLQHVDLYRLGPEEVDDLALEDLLEDGVMAVEWPDRWRRAPADAVRVRIEMLDGTRRRITVESSQKLEAKSQK